MDGRNLMNRRFEIVGENLRSVLQRDTSDSAANRKTGIRFTIVATAFITLSVVGSAMTDEIDPARVTEQEQLDNEAN